MTLQNSDCDSQQFISVIFHGEEISDFEEGSIQQLREQLHQALCTFQLPGVLDLDLSSVKQLDSSTLGLLSHFAYQTAAEKRVKLRIRGASKDIVEVFKVTHLHTIMDVVGAAA